ncbi:hypothetical protein F6455_18230 [Proteobacteria bacterium 005FR1]|nr:hypothetical protein [Proteobacteria bacterium 005FR1]
MQRQAVKVAIPEDVEFSELNLVRHTNGDVGFDWRVIERICEASSLPVELLRNTHEDNLAGVIMQWYLLHRVHGGIPDPVAEQLVHEALAEEAAGQSFSYQPGRA